MGPDRLARGCGAVGVGLGQFWSSGQRNDDDLAVSSATIVADREFTRVCANIGAHDTPIRAIHQKLTVLRRRNSRARGAKGAIAATAAQG